MGSLRMKRWAANSFRRLRSRAYSLPNDSLWVNVGQQLGHIGSRGVNEDSSLPQLFFIKASEKLDYFIDRWKVAAGRGE